MAGLIILVVLALICVGIYLYQASKKTSGNEANNNPDNQIVGGDRDEHGCIGSAGYSWCALKNKCLRIWEENCDEQLAAEMKNLFIKKYPQSSAIIKIIISLSDESHVRGSVLFGEPGVSEGGNFLAAKIDGQWEIVFDGNGGIPCTLSKYGFPNEMLADCF